MKLSRSTKDLYNPLSIVEVIPSMRFGYPTIFIDDVRLFDTAWMDFISLEEVVEKIRSINPNYKIQFENGYVPGDVLVAKIPN